MSTLYAGTDKGEDSPSLSLAPLANTDEQRIIDSEITLLEDKLRGLRTERNKLSPIAKLPLEILTMIFTLCMPRDVFILSAQELKNRTLVTHVCQGWREAALQYPPLWTNISLEYLSWQEECIGRAREASLTVRAIINSQESEEVLIPKRRFLRKVLKRSGAHIKDISICAPLEDLRSWIPAVATATPNVETILIHEWGPRPPGPKIIDFASVSQSQLSQLRILTVYPSIIRLWDSTQPAAYLPNRLDILSLSDVSSIATDNLLDLLSSTPSLVFLSLRENPHSMDSIDNSSGTDGRAIPLAKLARFNFIGLLDRCLSLLSHTLLPHHHIEIRARVHPRRLDSTVLSQIKRIFQSCGFSPCGFGIAVTKRNQTTTVGLYGRLGTLHAQILPLPYNPEEPAPTIQVTVYDVPHRDLLRSLLPSLHVSAVQQFRFSGSLDGHTIRRIASRIPQAIDVTIATQDILPHSSALREAPETGPFAYFPKMSTIQLHGVDCREEMGIVHVLIGILVCRKNYGARVRRVCLVDCLHVNNDALRDVLAMGVVDEIICETKTTQDILKGEGNDPATLTG